MCVCITRDEEGTDEAQEKHFSVDEGESMREAQAKRFSRASSHLCSKVCSKVGYIQTYRHV